MTRHREVYCVDHEGDFGLSGFAGALSSPTGPRRDAPTVPALAAQKARDDEDVQLGRDVRLLLESPLPDETIRTVWLAAVRERFDLADQGLDMRTWLHEIAGVCPARDRGGRGRNPSCRRRSCASRSWPRSGRRRPR
ncbi:hypothetical protein [Streptomyces cyaneus]|uniref:hypothetical protein n=1 Tax=Streptomyces cyaneus TaxID=1904 RepID=UPI000FF8A730|nr:hypothetical protein [Streptomyces cyaneus]